MNSTIKASKYIFNEYKKALLIFYSIIAAISLFMTFSYLRLSAGGNAEINFSGFGFSAIIFTFVSGLNGFKINFKFMQANNITRKRYYIATIFTLVFVSAIIAFLDVALTQLLKLIVPYQGLVEQIYRSQYLLGDFLWSFTLLYLAAGCGWFITMLYYKCNNFMKTVISIAPVGLIIILVIINNMTKGAIGIAIGKFLMATLGLTTMNPYVAAVSFTIAAAIAYALCYLLVRRMTLKD